MVSSTITFKYQNHHLLFMERMSLEDFPVEVLESVYNKWDRTKKPYQISWTSCSICKFLKNKFNIQGYKGYIICKEVCPLYVTEDCRRYDDESKLNIDYWNRNKGFSDSVANIELRWNANRLKFLTRLREVIELKRLVEKVENKVESYDKDVICVKCSNCGLKVNETVLTSIVHIKVDEKDRDVLTFVCPQCEKTVNSFRYSQENI